MVGWHELCNPEFVYLSVFSGRVSDPVEFRNFFFVINSKFSSGPNKSKQTRILNPFDEGFSVPQNQSKPFKCIVGAGKNLNLDNFE